MAIIKTFWNVLVIGLALIFAGILVEATVFMAREAINAHQYGLINLGKLSRMLTAP